MALWWARLHRLLCHDVRLFGAPAKSAVAFLVVARGAIAVSLGFRWEFHSITCRSTTRLNAVAVFVCVAGEFLFVLN